MAPVTGARPGHVLDVAAIKKDFPILDQDIVYLDSAASSQKPRAVLDAMTSYY